MAARRRRLEVPSQHIMLPVNRYCVAVVRVFFEGAGGDGCARINLQLRGDATKTHRITSEWVRGGVCG